MMFETGLFYVFLIGAIFFALSVSGINRMVGGHISSLNLVWVIRVVLGIIVGLVICYFTSLINYKAGIIGFFAGFALGLIIPKIAKNVFKSIKLKRWAVILIVITVLAGAVSAFL